MFSVNYNCTCSLNYFGASHAGHALENHDIKRCTVILRFLLFKNCAGRMTDIYNFNTLIYWKRELSVPRQALIGK